MLLPPAARFPVQPHHVAGQSCCKVSCTRRGTHMPGSRTLLPFTGRDRMRAAFPPCVTAAHPRYNCDSVPGSRPCPPRLLHDTLHLLPDKVSHMFHMRHVPEVARTLSIGTHRSARLLNSTHLKYEESVVMQDHAQDSLSIQVRPR